MGPVFRSSATAHLLHQDIPSSVMYKQHSVLRYALGRLSLCSLLLFFGKSAKYRQGLRKVLHHLSIHRRHRTLLQAAIYFSCHLDCPILCLHLAYTASEGFLLCRPPTTCIAEEIEHARAGRCSDERDDLVPLSCSGQPANPERRLVIARLGAFSAHYGCECAAESC